MTNSKPSLTPRQVQILREISAYTNSQCFSPTLAELARKLRLSRSTIYEHLTELRKKALITGTRGRARSLSLTAAAREVLENLAGDNQPAASECEIPLLGTVAAGIPIEAVEDPQVLPIGAVLAGPDVFALKVRGDSMIEDGINNGDYVICRKNKPPRDGQTVVARLDNNEVTVKRLYREKNKVRLQPANSSYSPIYSDNCTIEGTVTGVIRLM